MLNKSSVLFDLCRRLFRQVYDSDVSTVNLRTKDARRGSEWNRQDSVAVWKDTMQCVAVENGTHVMLSISTSM